MIESSGIIIYSHNFLTSYSPNFAGDEVGTLLRTPHNIDKLIQRSDTQPDLAKEAYWRQYQSA